MVRRTKWLGLFRSFLQDRQLVNLVRLNDGFLVNPLTVERLVGRSNYQSDGVQFADNHFFAPFFVCRCPTVISGIRLSGS